MRFCMLFALMLVPDSGFAVRAGSSLRYQCARSEEGGSYLCLLNRNENSIAGVPDSIQVSITGATVPAASEISVPQVISGSSAFEGRVIRRENISRERSALETRLNLPEANVTFNGVRVSSTERCGELRPLMLGLRAQESRDSDWVALTPYVDGFLTLPNVEDRIFSVGLNLANGELYLSSRPAFACDGQFAN